MREVMVIQPAPCSNYVAKMDGNELHKLEEQAKDNICKKENWDNVPSWCNHIVAAVEYGKDRATVYLAPFECDDWAWEEYFTNPARKIEYVIAFHRGTSKLVGV